eukprot:Gregarina_sp_Poly_1__1085@NODE_1265_length_4568_cov_50_983337_g860_i0_p1_GENE_NODE_1265_length_4568_cov_50_983337_g860_i0NODE_1265_length_4568_cov_50_983337_g860_i0_p1_ORF_typecomplete_len871_score100_99Pkinase/PF00069_25/2e66Pkinase_Tyr/PF07714_17/1_2e45Kinaselike/PF14531_6/8_4e16Pkinase_fungal/PF17667_1/9_7e07Kdo/PF06293_14/5_3e05APH/PF01636_23/0_00082RIO1/PF01163_22/0_0013WaaY/PF06176_11/0_0035Choline_kinase/PF01633_20/0_0036Haspin_kinase/PF12330_8/0_19P_proprotein/PF01483_20/9_1e03P_proprote
MNKLSLTGASSGTAAGSSPSKSPSAEKEIVWIPSPDAGGRDTETETAPSPSSPACHVSLTPSSPEPIAAEDHEWLECLHNNTFAFTPGSAFCSGTISLWSLVSSKSLLLKIQQDTTGQTTPPKQPTAAEHAASCLPSDSDSHVLAAIKQIKRTHYQKQPNIATPCDTKRLIINTTRLTEQGQPQISLEDLEPVKFQHRLSACQTILGRGTYGVVRLMKQKSSGKHYAVKSLDRSIVTSTGMESQVKLEILAQRLVSHPNTVRCYNVVTDAKHFHLILDYCSHGDLFRKLRSAPNRRLIEMDAFRLFLQLISGLLHIHSLGFCHRDLKLENLLLDEHNNLKIADFGWVARINGRNRSYNFCGTLDYLSPEMIQGTGHDYRVDIWAVGVLLYEILSGKPPFLSTRHFELLDRILFARIHQDKVGSLPHSRHIKEDALDAVRSFLQPDPDKRIHFKDVLKLRWVQRMLGEVYSVFLDSWKRFAPHVNEEDPVEDEREYAIVEGHSPGVTPSDSNSTPITNMLTARGLGLGPRRRTNAIRLSEHQLIGVLRGPLSSHSTLSHKRYSSGSSSPRPVATFRHNSAMGSLTRNPGVAEPWVVRSDERPKPQMDSEVSIAGRYRSGSGGDLSTQSLIRPMRLRRPIREHMFVSGADDDRRPPAGRNAVPRATSPASALRQSSPRQPRASQWNESTKSEDLRSSLIHSSDTTSALLTRRRSSDKVDTNRPSIVRAVNGHSASSCRATGQLPRRSRLQPGPMAVGSSNQRSAFKTDRLSAVTLSHRVVPEETPHMLVHERTSDLATQQPHTRLPSPPTTIESSPPNVALDSMRVKHSSPFLKQVTSREGGSKTEEQTVAVISGWPSTPCQAQPTSFLQQF